METRSDLRTGEVVNAVAGHPLTDRPGGVARPSPGEVLPYTVDGVERPVTMLRPDPRVLLRDGWGNLVFVLGLGGLALALYLRRPAEPATSACWWAHPVSSAAPWPSSPACPPWRRQLVGLLIGYFGLLIFVAWATGRVRRGSRRGALIAAGLLPIEAVFWFGFALPAPWVLGAVRLALIIAVWRRLGRAQPTSPQRAM